MTTQSWIAARVSASGEPSPVSHRTRRYAWLCLLLLSWLAASGSAQAQGVGNFCPIGTCDITNPHYVNVYWDSSLAQWDTDVAASSSDMAHDHIDHLTEALIHSKYFADLTQYSVTSVSMGPSISASGCAAAPSKLDQARSALPNLVNCLLLLYPNLKQDNVILAVYVPPQSMQVPGICQGPGEAGEHGEYGTAVGNVLFLPTTKACNGGSLAALFGVTTHEMVEATTDPNPPSPTGWKVGTTGDFYGQEIGDVCQTLKFSDVGFLFGGVANYFSDNANTCSTGFTKTAPTVSTATACGAGQNMTLKLTGSFGATPWDLGSGKFGKETLYLNAVINHQGKQWEAGNFEGLPRDSNLNQGKPDAVTFGAAGVSWSPGSITVSGFGAKYGTVMANGATAAVFPGDSIQVKVALNDTGQFATANLTAPAASQILNLAVTPTGGDPYIFVNAKADVTGTVADAGSCGIQSQLVSLMGWQGAVNPGSTGTSASGQFQSTYFASSVAGTQKVTATLASNSSVKASVPVPVHPILNSITPNVGPVAGGQSATLAGDGFDPGHTSVAFSGAGAQVNNVALQSIQVVTPKSPLGGDGDGTADVIATVNGLDSLSVPYKYVVPGKPYISFKSVSCKDHYIVVTVYDANAQPVAAPIALSAGYAAYFSNGQWVANMNTSTGVSVQVDKGGPFTATNTNSNLSSTASFPVLPGPICYNVRLISKVDFHIFEKGNPLDPVEVSQLNPGGRVATGGKKVTIWAPGRNVKGGTYVLDPAGTAGGGGLQVSTVGPERFRGAIHGRIFLTGGMKTESATGQPGGNVLEVQFAGPAFSIARAGQNPEAVSPLGRQLRLTFALPEGFSNPHDFHIVHLTMSGGEPTWVEDGGPEEYPYHSGLTRTVDQSGIYALLEVVGSGTETVPQQRQEQPQQQQAPPQKQPPPSQPQAAPQGSSVLVPDNAFPGGVLTGVVLGPDDKPVPNTPVNIAGGVPITLTGVVIGEEPPTTPQQPQQPCQPDPTTGQLPPGCQPPPPPPCQPDAAGNLPPGCQPPPPCQPDPTTGQLPAGCAPPTVSKPTDCAAILQRFARAAGVAMPSGQPGAAGPAAGAAAGSPMVTDANGRFGMCVPVDAPKVGVALPGGTPTSVPALAGRPTLPTEPPSFFQPRQKISIIGVMRNLTAEQGGRTWLLPAVNAWSPGGDQVITAFETPRDINPGPIQLSYTGGDGQPHQVQGNVFRILRATLVRSKLHSQEGADFEYTVQFGGQTGQNLCVEMQVGGPVVLVQAPPPQIPLDASGIGHFGGKIRATQVAPGAAVPFELTPNIVYCAGRAPSTMQHAPTATGSVSPMPSDQQAPSDQELFYLAAQDIYFDSDKSDLRPEAKQILAILAQAIKAHPTWKVQIEGNCDPIEGEGTTEYALALGERRSDAASQYLLQNGVSADALKTISYGREKPVCTDTSEDCLQKNRRDHFTLLL